MTSISESAPTGLPVSSLKIATPCLSCSMSALGWVCELPAGEGNAQVQLEASQRWGCTMKISAQTVILQVEKRTTMLEKCHTMLFMAAIECHAKCSAAMRPFVFFFVFFFCLSEIAMFLYFSWSFMCLTPLKLPSSLSSDELEEKENPVIQICDLWSVICDLWSVICDLW